MKIYRGLRTASETSVTADGLPLRAKRPSYDSRVIAFTWGDEVAGAERLALSILADCLGDDAALGLFGQFTVDVVSKLNSEWELLSEDIGHWRNFTCAIGYSAQQAVWTPAGSTKAPEPASPPMTASQLPRLLGNPNYRLAENVTRPSKET